MAGPLRITSPLLDVLEVLITALNSGEDLHGWAIMKEVKRSGPTVYGVLDRLEDMGWITGEWESRSTEPNKPRRRFYHVTPTGRIGAMELLRERRPQSLRRATVLKPGPGLPNRPDALPQGGTA